MRCRAFIGTISGLLLLAAPAEAARQAVFVTLWEGEGWPKRSQIDAVSHDGSTAVGFLEGDTVEEAIRWTAEGGIQSLGPHTPPPAFPTDLHATGVSHDGGVIVGNVAPDFVWYPFRWTLLDGVQHLLSTPAPFHTLEDLSDDGEVAVGFERGQTFRAISATPTSGITYLGELFAGEGSFANAANHDGSVIVGHAGSPTGWRAFRWTTETGMVALETPGGVLSQALGIYSDGNTIVGWADHGDSARSTEAMRWDAAGSTPLGHVYAPLSRAYAASANGRVIVGSGNEEYQPPYAGFRPVAFIWDERNGMRDLERVLEDDYGLDLGEWYLHVGTSISDDGLVIGGTGRRCCEAPLGFEHGAPVEGWIAILPPACDDGLDNDGDGNVDYPDDPGCASPDALLEDPACSDGLDNDGDGRVDWDGAGVGAADAECKGKAFRDNEDCGLGFELALLLPLWRSLRRTRRGPVRRVA